VVVRLASGTLLGAERIMRELVAGLSGLIGRAPSGAGEMASYCMVGIAVAGSAGGLAGGTEPRKECVGGELIFSKLCSSWI
jgi:hypothetical protein